ncbi:hypothetical protein LRC484719_46520 [Mycobacterium riyadhense]
MPREANTGSAGDPGCIRKNEASKTGIPARSRRVGGTHTPDTRLGALVSIGTGGAALVALAAEELGGLRLQRRLHQQLSAETGDLFKDFRQLPILGKQGIDLDADTVGG